MWHSSKVLQRSKVTIGVSCKSGLLCCGLVLLFVGFALRLTTTTSMQPPDAIMTEAPSSLWSYTTEMIQRNRVTRYVPLRGGSPVTFADALKCMREDEVFRNLLNTILGESPFMGYRWETPPVSAATVSRRFEFVLVNDPGLDRAPDTHVFADHLKRVAPGKSIVSFLSLGKDATLIAPCPLVAAETYVHLAPFVRHAPAPQVHELWQLVGSEMPNRLRETPVWLSTAGMGVAWLHVRIDQRPKYYAHQPYRIDEGGPHAIDASSYGRERERTYRK